MNTLCRNSNGSRTCAPGHHANPRRAAMLRVMGARESHRQAILARKEESEALALAIMAREFRGPGPHYPLSLPGRQGERRWGAGRRRGYRHAPVVRQSCWVDIYGYNKESTSCDVRPAAEKTATERACHAAYLALRSAIEAYKAAITVGSP